MDITQLILDDHQEQRRLFSILEQLDRTDTKSLAAMWKRLAAFLEARRLYPTDATRLAAFLVGAQSFLAAKAPQAVSVQLSAELEDGYATNAEAVIVSLKGDLQPYRVLAWNPSTPRPRL